MESDALIVVRSSFNLHIIHQEFIAAGSALLNIETRLEPLKKPRRKFAKGVEQFFTMNLAQNKGSALENARGYIVMENREYREAVEKYTVAMKSAKNLLDSGVIDQEDYQKIDGKMRKKYGIKKGTILGLI
jgi:hypothetical protein